MSFMFQHVLYASYVNKRKQGIIDDLRLSSRLIEL